MTLSRRKTLGLIGGGLVLAAAGGAGAFLATREPAKALAPWRAAGAYAEPRMNALSFALLAPNPHNRQPWLAELVGADQVRLWRDPARDLPVTDPFARQLTIGMGCFLELMEMAAAEAGRAVVTTLFPDGEAGPVADCVFAEGGAAPNPLFKAALRRRSHKGAFEPRGVDAAAADALRAAARAEVDIHREGETRDALRRLARDAWIAEAADPDAWAESVALLRIGKAEIEANPDGVDLGGPMLDALKAVGLFTRDAAADPTDPNTRAAIDETTAQIDAAPAIATILTAGNARADQIDAGRRWLRLNLAAAELGLALRPVSQALQEYEAVRPFYDAVHALLAQGGETVQMLGLLGYGPTLKPSPRWALETRLKNA